MKNILHTAVIVFWSILVQTGTSRAQFNSDSSQTYFICNASGAQSSVVALADGNGGTYSLWIDKRNGNAGTAVYGQHMDSLGVPLWAVNGKPLAEAVSKEIWQMTAISWQNGILLSWVQGGFGSGGDTLFCNYYDHDGISIWAQPTVVANKQGSIIYVNGGGLNIIPNDSGATIINSVTFNGGNDIMTFNRVDFSGNLRWPLDSMFYQGNGFYYASASDNHNGFYVSASTGGLGYPIYVGHFDLQGNQTISSPVNVCGSAGGRGNSAWNIFADADTNGYVVWGSYGNNDISVSKIKPDGSMPWSDVKSVCTADGTQDIPDAVFDGTNIYVTWNDGRPGASNAYIYMQKLDTAGNALWSSDGIEISNLNSYIPVPKIIKSGNNIYAAYLVGGGFRSQQVQPDSSVVWYQNGVVINVNNPPFYGDYKLVSAADGSVTAVWTDDYQDICAARVRPNGSLTAIAEQEGSVSGLFPNPATDQFSIRLNNSNVRPVILGIYNAMGVLVREGEYLPDVNGTITVGAEDLAGGIYFVKVAGTGYVSGTKVCISKK